MNTKVCLGAVFALLVLHAGGHVISGQRKDHNRFIYGQMVYGQDLKAAGSNSYPDWNPGEGICPLHPTNALQIASRTITNMIPNVTVDRDESYLTLYERNDQWFYDIQLSLVATDGAPKTWSRSVNLVVGIDGKVPEIESSENTRRRFGNGFRRKSNEQGDMAMLTPEEQAHKRAETKERLRQYQMEVIRSGMPPLPTPLTEAMDEQLVKEGILPPKEEKGPTVLSDPSPKNSWTNSTPDNRPASGIPNS